jgi:hypothetical protein
VRVRPGVVGGAGLGSGWAEELVFEV